jgi:hypothetical protein
MLLLSACSGYKAPDLPDLARESFSSEEILQRQKDLEEKTKEIESNPDCR